MARPAIIAEKTLETGFLDESLFVNGCDGAWSRGFRGFAETRVVSLGPALDGIDKGGAGKTKIEGGDCAAVSGLEQRLVFGGGKEVLVGTVGVVVEQLDAGHERCGGLAVGNGFGANQIAPEVGAEMRGVEAAEDAVPVGVVALSAQEQVAGLDQFIGCF